MRRVPVVAGLCILTFATALVAQGPQGSGRNGGGQGRGGDQPKTTPTEGRPAPDPELEHARQELQREMAEARRLQDQLKADQKAGNKEAVKKDNELLKVQREKVKVAQETVKTLQGRRGARGDAGRGTPRGGDGRGGRGGRGGI